MRKLWFPLLLIALVVALYSGLGSVKTLDLDTRYDAPVAPSTQPAPGAGSRIASRLAVGVRYRTLEELLADQQAAGFVRTGYFGKFWPATVTEIATDRNEIKFVRQNGTQHHYTKFDGYEMKMVRLMAGNRETIVVFRSANKR